MRVILKEDLKKVGKKGDIIKVADGYAKNYLFPKNLAIEANKSNIKDLDEKKKEQREKEDRSCQKHAEEGNFLKEKVIKITSKSGGSGKLFGSITTQDVSDAILKQAGIEIDKRKINIHNPIKHTGTHKVEISLHPKVCIELSIEVEG